MLLATATPVTRFPCRLQLPCPPCRLRCPSSRPRSGRVLHHTVPWSCTSILAFVSLRDPCSGDSPGGPVAHRRPRAHYQHWRRQRGHGRHGGDGCAGQPNGRARQADPYANARADEGVHSVPERRAAGGRAQPSPAAPIWPARRVPAVASSVLRRGAPTRPFHPSAFPPR